MACEERTIPPEIITEILYRLPTKSIGRFRCVSKGWLSLLTDPQFIKTHQNTLNQHHLILISDHLTLKSIPKTHLKNHEQVLESAMTSEPSDLESSRFYTRIYGSCDGLVLLAATDYDLIIFKLVVLNPTTGEFIELPEPGIYNYPYSIVTFGFGYDRVTDDYKVVIISYRYGVHVYSLRTNNTWRRVTDFPDDRVFDEGDDCVRVSGVFVNGFLHWIAKEKGDSDDELCLLVIVAFSLALETFTQMSPPLCNEYMDVDYMINNCLKLADLGGKLFIFQKVGGVLWLMTEYGVRESWTEISLKGFELDPLPRPIVFYDDNGNILVAIYGEILVYNIRKGRFPVMIKIFRTMDEGTYVESLISPKLNRTNWKSANSSKEICTELKLKDVTHNSHQVHSISKDPKPARFLHKTKALLLKCLTPCGNM